MSFHDRVVTMLITQVVKENWVKHCRDLSVIFVLKQPILRYVSGIKPGDTDEELLRDWEELHSLCMVFIYRTARMPQMTSFWDRAV